MYRREVILTYANGEDAMSQYLSMCQAFKNNVKFLDPSPVGPPNGSPYDADKLKEIVRNNSSKLPKSYRESFATSLFNALPQLVITLRQRFEDDQKQGQSAQDAQADVDSIANSLVGAVADWGAPAYSAQIKRFEAVVSNFYRSFLSKEQRSHVSLPLIETVPPLVTFAPSPDAGPFTWPADAVKEFIDVPVGVVSLPGSYRDHPLIWPALAHETGGHDVLHADPGLLNELAQGVQALSGLPQGIGALWASWIDEAASDVYGLLNIGPAFGVSLAAFFSALEVAEPGGANQTLGRIGSTLLVRGNALLDPHPVDLLRVYLAMGATSVLKGLAPATRQNWITLLASIAKEAAGRARSIDVFDVDQRAIVEKLPLMAMANAAQAVGAYIATAQLSSLESHSVQDIETWDDADEATATAIRKAAGSEASIIALGDDAQLLAGTTMALYETRATAPRGRCSNSVPI
jgi:hypothetical protein